MNVVVGEGEVGGGGGDGVLIPMTTTFVILPIPRDCRIPIFR